MFQFGVCVTMDQHVFFSHGIIQDKTSGQQWLGHFKLLTKKSNAIRGVILNKINFYFKTKDFI